MVEIFWKRVAWFVASRPWLVNFLINSALKRPYCHLDGYMGRWWLTPKFLLGKDEFGNPFPYEWVPSIFKIRLHHILRADNERHLHDHPADNRSFLLIGWYQEENVFGVVERRIAGDTVLRRAECFHKIAEVSKGGVWTLWMLSKKRQKWGFMVNDRKVYWRDYLNINY